MSYLDSFERGPQFQELGDPDLFRKEVEERAKTATPEETERLLLDLEQYSQAPDRSIELYTDPDLDTFCCAEVPAEKKDATGKIVLDEKGKVVTDPTKKPTYLIGVPFLYAAGQAPQKFLRGEILHERGHAQFSQFSMFSRLRALARQEGYDEGQIMSGINCVEDPRMERLVGGPLHDTEREQMFEKNRLLIIPSIAKGLAEMQPAEQFKFILKLEGLWNIYGKDLKDTPKPWSIDGLHPDVAREFKQIETYLRRITGDATNPAMKVMPEVEKLFVDNIWSAQKRLIDKYPPKKEEGKAGKGKGKGQPGQGKPQPGEPTEPLDPSNTDNWPPELKKIIEKFKNEHQKKLEQKAEQQKADAEKGKENAENLAQAKHELQKARDQFDTPEMREKYNNLSAEVRPITGQLKRTLKRFVPKVTEPGLEWGRKGGRYSERRRIMRAGSGHEKPMGTREHPEETALALQLLVDVSGSMYGQNKERIGNAVKACIALSEAAVGNNIVIEILANDEKNVTEDIRYQIKGFNEPYDGRTKSRIVQMMEAFGGDNKDADAIMAAIPRLRKRIQTLRAEADRVGSLIIDMTDSETQSPDTKDAVEQARKFSPMEGTAITPEANIPAMVKYHFGPQSIIPRSINEFPDAIQQILERHARRLKPRQ